MFWYVYASISTTFKIHKGDGDRIIIIFFFYLLKEIHKNSKTFRDP